MPVLSFLMAWTGYSLFTWGVATIRSCNVNWTQVAWPGKFTGCNPDGALGAQYNKIQSGQTNVAPPGAGTPNGPNNSTPGVRPGAKVPT